MNPYLKYGPGGSVDPKKVTVDGKQYDINSPEYKQLYNSKSVSLLPVDEGKLPVYNTASLDVVGEAPDWLKKQRAANQPSLYDQRVQNAGLPENRDMYRNLGANISKPVFAVGNAAAEITGVPGAVRFAQNPYENIKGAAKVLSDLSSPGGYMAMFDGGYSSDEEYKQAFNTLDAFGIATGGVGLAKNAFGAGKNMVKQSVNAANAIDNVVAPIDDLVKPATVTPSVVTPTTVAPPVVEPWKLQEMPGLHIKSTMTGSPFEKQLSKTGEINVNNILSHINKSDVGQQDKFILNKVLTEKFADKSKIGYNDFKKAVSDELVTLNRTEIPNYEHNAWGVAELGYAGNKPSSYKTAIQAITEDDEYFKMIKSFNKQEAKKITENGVTKYEVPGRYNSRPEIIPEDKIDGYLNYINTDAENFYKSTFLKKAEYEDALKNMPEIKTHTYSNEKKFGIGSEDHFDKSTLGHVRTLVNPDEPEIMHILEQQSDYWQKHAKDNPFVDMEKYNKNLTKGKEKLTRLEKTVEDDGKHLEYMKQNKKSYAGDEISDFQINQFEETYLKKAEQVKLQKGNLENPMQKDYLGKNHQERLLQENVKLASESGKSKMRYPTPETAAKIQKYNKKVVGTTEDWGGPMSDQGSVLTDYSPEHKTILEKYKETKKTIKKVFGKEPATITDAKGNTWYEFDIPDSYKKGKAEIKAFSVNPFTAGATGSAATGAALGLQEAQGPTYRSGGPVDPLTPEEEEAAMRGMMKARIAIDSHFGNPAAKRLTEPFVNPYIFTGNEKDYGSELGVPAGEQGTHFMASMGEYAVPFIQQNKDGGLYFNEYASPSNKEAMKFETEKEAEYFANENYKKVAPLMKNYGKYTSGGESSNIPVEIERNERVYTPDGQLLMETPSNAPTHEKGGVKVKLPAGSLVFPKSFFNKLDAVKSLPGFKKITEDMLSLAEEAYNSGKKYSSGGNPNK